MTADERPRAQPRIKGRRPNRHYVGVTDEQENELQARAKAQNITVPVLLVEAALGDKVFSPRIVANELAGVRRILAEEEYTLRLIAENAGTERWNQGVWELAAKGIEWRNQKLTEKYGW